MNAPKNPTKRHVDPNNDGNIIVNNRKTSLVIAAVLGLLLWGCMYYLLEWCDFLKSFLGYNEFADLTRNSLSLLALGLPTFFILWLFRTHDVREQLKKTQENINKTEESIRKTEEGIDNNTFFECIRLLASEEKIISKKAALEQLMYLRRENPLYKERIDSLTQGSVLEKANLRYAQLNDINLSRAWLHETHLQDSKFIKANLTTTNLIDADLSGANLSGANLFNTDLSGANLSDAKLSDTDLTGAKLSGTDLTDAKLIKANLSKADLTNTKLIKADLSKANLTGTYLNDADLTNTDLYNTDLTGAELYGTNLEKAKNYDTAIFKGAKYDKNTKFPPDFDPEKADCIKYYQ